MARSKAGPVKIIVDVHERQSGIAETLAGLGAEIEIESLPTGDYAVGADTLVERKRVLDLHGAVLKGRPLRTCSRMNESPVAVTRGLSPVAGAVNLDPSTLLGRPRLRAFSRSEPYTHGYTVCSIDDEPPR